MGTPGFAVPTLETLIDAGHEIAAVYTQPPRPGGRGMGLQMSPVQRFANEKGLLVETPVSLRSGAAADAFAALKPDAAVIVAYGLILRVLHGR